MRTAPFPSATPIALLLLLPLTLGHTIPAAAQEADHFLTLDHYLDWEEVQDPQISPDGRQIVYTRRWMDGVNDRWESELWIMNADGSRNRFLADGSSPRWSPDGTRVAYLAQGEPQGSQIFVRWMDAEGATSQITRLEHSPSNIEWSPDGRSLAFQALVPPPDDDSWRIRMPTRPRGATWTADAHIEERLHFRRDRAGFLPRGHQHLFVVSADGGTPRQLTRGDWDHTSPRWTADGGRIVFESLRVEDAEYEWRHSEIYDVSVATREIRQLTDRRGPDSGPVPSPDGRHIAFTGHEWTEDTFFERKLYVMDSDGSGMRELAAELDRSPMGLFWAPDGSGVYFNVNDSGTRNLYFAALNGSLRAVTDDYQVLQVSSLADDGRTAAGVVSTSHDPGTLVRVDVGGGVLEPLFHTNRDALADIQLGEVEEIWYRSFDDWNIQGWIVKPPDFDPSRRYPLILVIHGGPHVMWDKSFNFAWQDHAARGYVVLYTNPRGSSGYGSAFGNEINNAYPSHDYDDLMIGVDSLLARGYIDENNLFVYGGSGGGVLTAWIVGHTDRFTAAVSKAPVINWMSFVGTTDGSSWYRNFEDLPWNDPSEHLERSPLMYVGNVTTPTMLMTGELDMRTPISQTEEFYMALKMERVPTAMIRLTDGWHSRRLPPSNFFRVQLYLRNWFERFMVGDTPVTERLAGEDR
jgi:dipeptidyl aminopeptidase/acylaminoacyl peptidase